MKMGVLNFSRFSRGQKSFYPRGRTTNREKDNFLRSISIVQTHTSPQPAGAIGMDGDERYLAICITFIVKAEIASIPYLIHHPIDLQVSRIRKRQILFRHAQIFNKDSMQYMHPI